MLPLTAVVELVSEDVIVVTPVEVGGVVVDSVTFDPVELALALTTESSPEQAERIIREAAVARVLRIRG